MALPGQVSVKIERSGSNAVVEISGRVDSSNTHEFQHAILAGLEPGDKALILECTNLVYTSSAGLRVMLSLARQFQSPRRFAICGLADDILEIFKISGFDRIMTIRSTLKEALED